MTQPTGISLHLTQRLAWYSVVGPLQMGIWVDAP